MGACVACSALPMVPGTTALTATSAAAAGADGEARLCALADYARTRDRRAAARLATSPRPDEPPSVAAARRAAARRGRPREVATQVVAALLSPKRPAVQSPGAVALSPAARRRQHRAKLTAAVLDAVEGAARPDQGTPARHRTVPPESVISPLSTAGRRRAAALRELGAPPPFKGP